MFVRTIEQIKQTLKDHDAHYQKIIDDFGQVTAYESRLSGKLFGLNEHIKGLIYAQLSNQRPWGPIANNLARIDEIFNNYDSETLKKQEPKKLASDIQLIKCGNRAIAAQMRDICSNIETFERIISHQGSLDAYVISKKPDVIATELSSGNKYKLKQIGFTLATEYLRNIGVNAIKPDLHICRMIGPERLGFIDKSPTPEEAYQCVMQLEQQSSDSAVFIDNLLWIFAAQDYGNICSASPKCNECGVTLCATNPLHRISSE
jgi:hypothetical protein